MNGLCVGTAMVLVGYQLGSSRRRAKEVWSSNLEDFTGDGRKDGSDRGQRPKSAKCGQQRMCSVGDQQYC